MQLDVLFKRFFPLVREVWVCNDCVSKGKTWARYPNVISRYRAAHLICWPANTRLLCVGSPRATIPDDNGALWESSTVKTCKLSTVGSCTITGAAIELHQHMLLHLSARMHDSLIQQLFDWKSNGHHHSLSCKVTRLYFRVFAFGMNNSGTTAAGCFVPTR